MRAPSLGRRHNQTGQHVAVSAQELRRAVEHNVHPVGDRQLMIRRHERVVQERQQAVLLRPAAYLRDVDNFEGRVGRCLHIDRLRIRTQRRLHLLDIGHVDEGRFDLKPVQNRRQQTVGSSVYILGYDNMIACGEEQEGGGDRCHPRSERVSVRSPSSTAI